MNGSMVTILKRLPWMEGLLPKATCGWKKSRGLKEVCFARKRGLKEEDMCKSTYIYKKLRNFRAGIEAGISWLKRGFGLTRFTWKSFRSFRSYSIRPKSPAMPATTTLTTTNTTSTKPTTASSGSPYSGLLGASTFSRKSFSFRMGWIK